VPTPGSPEQFLLYLHETPLSLVVPPFTSSCPQPQSRAGLNVPFLQAVLHPPELNVTLRCPRGTRRFPRDQVSTVSYSVWRASLRELLLKGECVALSDWGWFASSKYSARTKDASQLSWTRCSAMQINKIKRNKRKLFPDSQLLAWKQRWFSSSFSSFF
jgi:hypothetical protein